MTDPTPEISDSVIFLEMMAAHSDDIRVDRITLELTQDLAAASVLTRLAYWFSPSKKNGQKRTRIRSDGKDWVAKARHEWWAECGVTEKEIRRINKLLVNLGVIDIIVKKFDGNPTTHYHLNIETYHKLYKETIKKNITIWPKGPKGSSPKGHNDQAQRAETITREYKQENKTEELDKTLDSGQARILSLFQKCFNSVFSCEGSAYEWLGNLGLSENFLGKLNPGSIPKNIFLIQLRAAAEYVQIYYSKSLKQGKNCDPAAYFRKTWENEWYLQKR